MLEDCGQSLAANLSKSSIPLDTVQRIPRRLIHTLEFLCGTTICRPLPRGVSDLTAVPVSIDPCVLASGNETIFEGSEIEGSLSRRRRHTQPGGSDDLLSVGAYHKTLVKETSGDRRCAAKSDPWQALLER